MLTLLGTIILLYVVWLLVRPLLIIYARRKYTERINDMFGQAFGRQEQAPPNPAAGRQNRRRAGGKIFSRDEGEYVDFEEIDGGSRNDMKAGPQEQASAATSSYTPREPQVSDADWEEIR